MKKKLNISIDDVSPHPRSSTKVLEQCHRVFDEFPDAKFTLFVPAAYWRTIGETATERPFIISDYQDFCKEMKALPKHSFELGYHGLFHGIPGRSNNDELQSIGLDDALKLIAAMKEVVHKAGLDDEFKGILRPPAWRMSPDAFQACLEHDITTFALSPDEYLDDVYWPNTSGQYIIFCFEGRPTGTRELNDKLWERAKKKNKTHRIIATSDYTKQWMIPVDVANRLLTTGKARIADIDDKQKRFVCRNEKYDNYKSIYVNCNPPFKPLKLFDKTEVVYHAIDTDKNYLSAALADDLIDFLRQNKDDIEFCFIEGLL